jgi:hypothetical protein
VTTFAESCRIMCTARCRLPTAGYLVSLCGRCFRQKRQNFENSSRSVVFFLFLVVL